MFKFYFLLRTEWLVGLKGLFGRWHNVNNAQYSICVRQPLPFEPAAGQNADACIKANRGSPIAICPPAQAGQVDAATVCLHAKWVNKLIKAKLMKRSLSYIPTIAFTQRGSYSSA